MSGLSKLSSTRPSQARVVETAEALGRLHVDIPSELLKAAKLRAVQTDISLRELVIEALAAHLGR
jgi:predicted HicB family RNase H-like nuclease